MFMTNFLSFWQKSSWTMLPKILTRIFSRVWLGVPSLLMMLCIVSTTTINTALLFTNFMKTCLLKHKLLFYEDPSVILESLLLTEPTPSRPDSETQWQYAIISVDLPCLLPVYYKSQPINLFDLKLASKQWSFWLTSLSKIKVIMIKQVLFIIDHIIFYFAIWAI